MLKFIWLFGSLIFLFLGTIHLILTFFTNKFESRDEEVVVKMKSASPILTRDTSIWKAWIGFNASHSSGVMFIGLINVYIAVQYFELIGRDLVFLVINLTTVGFYLWLARKYWFKSPFRGILITFCCYLLVLILTLIPI